jgi:hypothetical protein
MAQCRAHTKDGQPCQEAAVDGYPVCHLHGAGSPEEGRPGGRPGGRPIVHGAYSKAVRPEDVPTLTQLRALGLSLEEEVAVARLQLSRALAWADAERPVRCDGKQCPYELVDSRLSLVSRVALRCQRIAEAVEVRLSQEEEADRIVAAINKHVSDPETRAAIARELGRTEQ